MAEDKKPSVGDAASDGGETPLSVQIASRGIRTADDAANFQSALLGDLMAERVTVKKTNAACNVVGKLLKVVELQQKYGGAGENRKPLHMADPDDAARLAAEQKKAKLRAELAELEAAGR